jgi:hypothetical protein
VHALAEAGTKGGGGSLPHLGAIQKSFGKHDVSGVQAYSGGAAAKAAEGMGAEAFATGNKVAFKGGTDVHTAAHEAAHVVQQRQGVSLSGGVGKAGDGYEQQADKVADAVVAGKSAEGLLGGGGGGGGGAVQKSVQKKDEYVKPDIKHDGGHSKGSAPTTYKPIDVKGGNPQDSLNSDHFKVFEKRVTALLAGIQSQEDPKAVATEIWLAAMSGMNATQQDYENAPLVAGSSYEKQMSAQAFQDLIPKFDTLVGKINSAFAKANVSAAKSWGFWSGEGAKDAAGANCESTLEGGYIGSIFDAINISGGWDMQMWGALSRAFANAAVEKVEGREFHIFVGSGRNGTEPLTTENIWAQVESKVVYAAAKRNPNMVMTVHAVTHPNNKSVPDSGGKGCNWASDPVRPVGVEPMRAIARDKANKTYKATADK